MFRLILLLFLPLWLVKAEDFSTIRYELSPFTVDLIVNWKDLNKFPFKRHFIWEQEEYDFRNFHQGTMSKTFSDVSEETLRKSINEVLKSLGDKEGNTRFNIKRHELRSRFTGEFLITGFYFDLSASEKVHSFFEWINNYYTNIASNPFSQSFETPVVSAKFTILSMPAELVRKHGLDFFPSSNLVHKAQMDNKSFQKYLEEFLKKEGVSLVGEYMCRAVSGKAMVTRDVEEYLYPEGYDFFGKTGESRIFNNDSQKWEADSKWVEVHGIQALTGEPRDIGNVFEITPQVEPDGRTVSMDIKISLLRHLGWTDFNKEEDIRMPLLQALATETRMISILGQTRPVSLMHYNNRQSNISNSVRKEDLVNKSLDKCVIVYVSLESNKMSSRYDKADGDWSFYMTPVGSLAKSAFSNLTKENGKTGEKVKELLTDMGVKFQQGSFFHYDPEYSIISTFNKASEIKKLISFLPKNPNLIEKNIYQERANVYASDIVLNLSQAYASKIGLNDKSDLMRASVLRKILTGPFDGKEAIIQGLSTIVTQNGNTAVNRDVIELYSPESFDFQKSADKTLMLPNFGDPRDVGFVFELTPQIDPANKEIEIEIKDQMVDVSGWLNLRNQKSSAIFKSTSLDTRLKGFLGQSYINSYEVKNKRVIIKMGINQLDFLEREQP